MSIDCHVHVIGNGSSGTGCWLKVSSPYQKLLARLMLKELGIAFCALKADLDQIYFECLQKLVSDSELKNIIILAHELPYLENGTSIANFNSFYVPNDHVIKLSKNDPRFLAGISIHPARKDAIYELKRLHGEGAVLYKCLPNCQNIDCSNPNYKEFWETMAKLGIPFLAHTGGELSLPVYNASYSDPTKLKLALECGVNVIAAHCGTRSLLWDKHYLNVLAKMMQKYSNLYCDNSGMQTPFRSAYFKNLLEEPFVSRVIHGSDLPIPISGMWATLRGMSNWASYKESKLCSPLQRDIIIKKSMGMPEASFNRIYDLLPRKI